MKRVLIALLTATCILLASCNKEGGQGTANKFEYVDMGPAGKWATFNVGATSEGDGGKLYAWGETQTKSYYEWLTYKWMQTGREDWKYITKYCFADGKVNAIWYDDAMKFIGDGRTVLDPADDPATMLWGTKWRTPTPEDWEALLDESDYRWTWTDSYQGCAGMMVESITGSTAGNRIFLPAAGSFQKEVHYEEGTRGDYWSRSLDDANVQLAKAVSFRKGSAGLGSLARYRGHSIRAVRMD